MPALDVIGLLLEVLSWVGLGAGAVLAIAWIAARSADGGWREVEVVVVPGVDQAAPVARWFAGDELHERPLDADEQAKLEGGVEDAIGWATAGGRLRFERRSHAARVLGLLALILLVVGVVALAAGLILSLTAG
ncbi:hypothetical protein FLP10_06760 [Agromyces intestinalis]|uniref:Uncharacterized protein n=1 Tax=Agromyces intestinalis TaxID=2592652 RepID=A0A5C1YHB2_9MICO|nr:hypothetical protein [Agromyces intestinalis]QEO14152.1 hypothetical protein FLP10_06760 [Agromyces intestinalis]